MIGCYLSELPDNAGHVDWRADVDGDQVAGSDDTGLGLVVSGGVGEHTVHAAVEHRDEGGVVAAVPHQPPHTPPQLANTITHRHLALREDVDPAPPVEFVQEEVHSGLLHSPTSHYGDHLAQLPERLQGSVEEDDLRLIGIKF